MQNQRPVKTKQDYVDDLKELQPETFKDLTVEDISDNEFKAILLMQDIMRSAAKN